MYASEGAQLPECFTVSSHVPHSELKKHDLNKDGKTYESSSAKSEREYSEDDADTEKTAHSRIDDGSKVLSKGSDAITEAHLGDILARGTSADSGNQMSQRCSWYGDEHQVVLDRISSAINGVPNDQEWMPFEQYLKNSRINISVRQVTGPGKGFPQMEESNEQCNENKRTRTDIS